ncbi:hypothetical protein KIPB_000743 [Kipferlia bialata]|uniref:Uncharacterized protein n=1 Tax=Kipferlia bialata TaxID=797122 RepID=A0A9K3CPM1_9EUKA|nr:hypothetical protein KIPB_000743 [Kipferlia bialata]|eukprot:g743.t1
MASGTDLAAQLDAVDAEIADARRGIRCAMDCASEGARTSGGVTSSSGTSGTSVSGVCEVPHRARLDDPSRAGQIVEAHLGLLEAMSDLSTLCDTVALGPSGDAYLPSLSSLPSALGHGLTCADTLATLVQDAVVLEGYRLRLDVLVAPEWLSDRLSTVDPDSAPSPAVLSLTHLAACLMCGVRMRQEAGLPCVDAVVPALGAVRRRVFPPLLGMGKGAAAGVVAVHDAALDRLCPLMGRGVRMGVLLERLLSPPGDGERETGGTGGSEGSGDLARVLYMALQGWAVAASAIHIGTSTLWSGTGTGSEAPSSALMSPSVRGSSPSPSPSLSGTSHSQEALSKGHLARLASKHRSSLPVASPLSVISGLSAQTGAAHRDALALLSVLGEREQASETERAGDTPMEGTTPTTTPSSVTGSVLLSSDSADTLCAVFNALTGDAMFTPSAPSLSLPLSLGEASGCGRERLLNHVRQRLATELCAVVDAVKGGRHHTSKRETPRVGSTYSTYSESGRDLMSDRASSVSMTSGIDRDWPSQSRSVVSLLGLVKRIARYDCQASTVSVNRDLNGGAPWEAMTSDTANEREREGESGVCRVAHGCMQRVDRAMRRAQLFAPSSPEHRVYVSEAAAPPLLAVRSRFDSFVSVHLGTATISALRQGTLSSVFPHDTALLVSSAQGVVSFIDAWLDEVDIAARGVGCTGGVCPALSEARDAWSQSLESVVAKCADAIVARAWDRIAALTTIGRRRRRTHTVPSPKVGGEDEEDEVPRPSMDAAEALCDAVAQDYAAVMSQATDALVAAATRDRAAAHAACQVLAKRLGTELGTHTSRALPLTQGMSPILVASAEERRDLIRVLRPQSQTLTLTRGTRGAKGKRGRGKGRDGREALAALGIPSSMPIPVITRLLDALEK